MTLDDETATLYAGALHAIARADGEVHPMESALLQKLVAAHSAIEVDPEMLFFDPVTAESFAAALRKRRANLREIGLALASDAVALSNADGDLNGQEAHAILRFLRALGCTAQEVHAVTDELDEWIGELG